jgi:hypothetical protein
MGFSLSNLTSGRSRAGFNVMTLAFSISPANWGCAVLRGQDLTTAKLLR